MFMLDTHGESVGAPATCDRPAPPPFLASPAAGSVSAIREAWAERSERKSWSLSPRLFTSGSRPCGWLLALSSR